MTPILVTGSSGYIGGRLVSHLASAGFEVRAGTRNPEAVGVSGQVIPVGMHWENRESLVAACGGCGTVIHLASVNEIESAADPIRATVATTIYTQRLAAAAQEAGVRRFLYFSTVHVYGSPLEGVITEASPANPAHPYSISHKAAEDYLRYMVPTSGMEIDVFRLTNSFGWPMRASVDRWSLIANDTARQAATTGRIILKTPGTQVRDFITLTDVCRATVWLCGMEPHGGSFELYNLGGDWTASIFEIAQRVSSAWAEVTGNGVPVERPEPPAGAPPAASLKVDVSKLSSLGFELLKNHDEELEGLVRRCAEWFGR